MKRVLAVIALWAILLMFLPERMAATEPPRPGQDYSDSYRQFMNNRQALSTRSLVPLARRALTNRNAVRLGIMSPAAAKLAGGTAITGSRSIPVLLGRFSNIGNDPYPTANLQRELFDGPWPTGTMRDYYREISYGQFTVNGTVFPWRALSNNDAFYEGPAGCNGLCNNGRTADFLRDTLTTSDSTVNFSQFDNDGPDNVPNSGDDDGFVDFVAFVHPESGGECRGNANNNIWSHRYAISGWGSPTFTTNDARNGGGFIQVDDYVIMPAFACDGTTMIQIGVFSHEFGHAFGLPDLYDTDDGNGNSEGLGNWCLMAGGSWGGDGSSPDRPVHMSAWAKEYLGWVLPTNVTANLTPASIARFEDNAVAFKIPISTTQHYLVTNIQKVLFDGRFPTAGLAILKVNESVVNAGLANNRVNADENNQGVELVEADGRKDLDNASNRADAGDLYPGSSNVRIFDNSTNPASIGNIAVCNVTAPGDTATAEIRTNNGRCAATPPTGCTSLAAPSPGSVNPADWIVMLVPILSALVWILWRPSLGALRAKRSVRPVL